MLLKQSRCHRVLAWAVLVASGTRFGIYVPVKSPIIKWRTKEKDHGNCSGMVQPEKKKNRVKFLLRSDTWRLNEISPNFLWQESPASEKWDSYERDTSTVEICLQFSECFQCDIIQGLAGIPRWGLWLPRQHWRQTQPRKWMCQITQCHPLGESCRCVYGRRRMCVHGAMCAVCVCRYWEFDFYHSERVVTYISSHPLSHFHLSLPVSHPSFLFSSFVKSCLFFLPHTKCNLSSSTSVSHRHDFPIFSFLYFVRVIIWTIHSCPVIKGLIFLSYCVSLLTKLMNITYCGAE